MRTCCDRVVDVFLTSLFWEGRLRNYQCNRKRAVLSGFGMGLVLWLSRERDKQNGMSFRERAAVRQAWVSLEARPFMTLANLD